jgi:uncharacterized membrane protein YeiH
MHDLLAVSLIFFTAIFTMIFKLIEKKFQVTLFIFDSLGLGLFKERLMTKTKHTTQ